MNILHISTSISNENSFSIKLGQSIIEKLLDKNTQATVIHKDLAKSPLPYYGELHYKTLLLSENTQSEEAIKVLEISEQSIKEIETADTIVIGVPMYNFGIPATLKTWIDHICKAKRTFNYTENGPKGLLTGKKVYLAISSGGVYTNSEMQASDFTESFLRASLGFLGMTDITAIRVEGIGIPGIKENSLEKAISSIQI